MDKIDIVQSVRLASIMTQSLTATSFIPALIFLSLTLLRTMSIVLSNLESKEPHMNKLFRFALIFASSFCETAWAGIVGVVFSAMTGHSEVISVLAKRTCSLLYDGDRQHSVRARR